MNKRQLNKLARKCFDEHIKTLAPGETAHCNHDGCPAGEDTRGRLYLTRKHNPSELVVWFCHNCTEGGAFNTSGKMTLRPHSTPKLKGDELQHIIDVMERSMDVVAFAGGASKALSYQQEQWLNTLQPLWYWAYYPEDTILYDPVDQSLVFPIFTTDPEQDAIPVPLAMQKRYHRDYGPKCITTKANDNVTVRTFLRDQLRLDNAPVVVVEDMLSGLRLRKDTGCTAYVLFGNHMDITELVAHKEEFNNGLIVWLDNDNDQVLENANKIYKRAEMLGIPVTMVDKDREPKKCTPTELRAIIDVAALRVTK